MSLSFERFRTLINSEDRLNTYGEFLNILENIVESSKVDVDGADVTFTRSVVSGQRNLKDICDKIYNGLVNDESADGMGKMIDELEEEYSLFIKFLNKEGEEEVPK